MNKKHGTIYFLLDEHHGKDAFTFINFCKSIKHSSALKYLKKCFIRKIKPVGGVKICYQHCLALKNAGYKSDVIKLGHYEDCFFNYDITPIHIDKIGYELETNDIVVATEFRPYNGLKFQNATKVLFAQNWLGFSLFLSKKDQLLGFSGIGYQHIFTCSHFIKNKLTEYDQEIASVITNGIDLNVFKPNIKLRVKNRILAFSRKNHSDLKKIKKLISAQKEKFELVVVDALTETELVHEYQKSDIFLATGYPEGFGLPALEAMACGCAVVGFSGGGGLEYMHHNVNSLIADDGDVDGAAKYTAILFTDLTLKERLRKQGIETSINFSLEKMNNSVVESYLKLTQA